MAVANTLKLYLDKKHVAYDVRELPPFASPLEAAADLGISAGSFVHAVVMEGEVGPVMVVLPVTHSVDVEALNRLLHRQLVPASDTQLAAVFRDCTLQFIPPLGEAYGLRTILDDRLLGPDAIYFAAGDDTHVIQVSNEGFHDLLASAWLASNFSNEIATPPAAGHTRAAEMPALRHRIEKLQELPAMPEMAQRILALHGDPNADANKLALAVEHDPSLAAQVMRYANSPFFAYQGKVDSVRTAISRVLGYDMVMSLALGIAALRPFKIPTMGPLGLNPQWRHATYSAALVPALGREMSREQRPVAGLSYLAGLLHNFGHVLLGHMFKREFFALSDLITAHPATPITTLERELLGVDHGQIGAWLMESWGLPQEIVVAVREHHNPHYDGPHAVYSRLVLVSDCMLKGHGIGEGESSEPPVDILGALGLDELRTLMVMNRILEGCEGLNLMAQGLAA